MKGTRKAAEDIVENSRKALLSRIGCSTLAFKELSLKDALEAIVRLGFDRIDLAMPIPKWLPHFDPLSSSPAMKQRLIEHMREIGLRVSSLNLVPGHLNMGNVQYQMAFIKSSMMLGKALGAYTVTIPTGKAVDDSQWLEDSKIAIRHIRELANFAEEVGIELSLEAPHQGTLAADLDETRRFYELLDDERVKCTFDTSHVLACGQHSLAEAAGLVGAQINHVHLRDAKGSDIHVTPGRGDGDFRELFEALCRIGYAGDLILELEPRREQRFLSGKYEGLKRRIKELVFVNDNYFFPLLTRRPPQAPLEIDHIGGELIFAKNHLYQIMDVEPPKGASEVVDLARLQAPKQFYLTTQEPNRRKIRVGILGCGFAGQAHGQAYSKLDNVEIAGVCDVDEERANRVAAALGCDPYYHLGDFLNEAKPDLVSNCTREWDHYHTGMRLLDAGVDLFCEKILAERWEKAQELVKQSKEKGRRLAVNYNYHFLPAVMKVKEMLESDRYGEIAVLNIFCHAQCYHHALDIARYLGGRVTKVTARYLDIPELRRVKQWNSYADEMLYLPSLNCSTILEFENGAMATINSSGQFSAKRFLLGFDLVFRKRGYISVSNITYSNAVGDLFFTLGNAALYDIYRGLPSREFTVTFDRSIRSFVEAYLDDQPFETDGEYALEIMRLERAVVESNRLGRTIELPSELQSQADG